MSTILIDTKTLSQKPNRVTLRRLAGQVSDGQGRDIGLDREVWVSLFGEVGTSADTNLTGSLDAVEVLRRLLLPGSGIRVFKMPSEDDWVAEMLLVEGDEWELGEMLPRAKARTELRARLAALLMAIATTL